MEALPVSLSSSGSSIPCESICECLLVPTDKSQHLGSLRGWSCHQCRFRDHCLCCSRYSCQTSESSPHMMPASANHSQVFGFWLLFTHDSMSSTYVASSPQVEKSLTSTAPRPLKDSGLKALAARELSESVTTTKRTNTLTDSSSRCGTHQCCMGEPRRCWQLVEWQ